MSSVWTKNRAIKRRCNAVSDAANKSRKEGSASDGEVASAAGQIEGFSSIGEEGSLTERDLASPMEEKLSSDGELVAEDLSDDDNEETELNVSANFRDHSVECSPLDQLREWAINAHIPHNSLKGLLSILRKNYDATLPSDPRTLLGTPKFIADVKICAGGKYFHLGIEQCVRKYAETKDFLSFSNLEVVINIDGVNVTRSGKHVLWPILCSFENEDCFISNSVYVIGIFYGSEKPNCVGEFLEAFIEDLDRSKKSGINFGEHTVYCNLKYFVCDAPARKMLKCIKAHNAYYGCERCIQKGSHSRVHYFPNVQGILRTDESFRLQTNSEHHLGISPLLNLGIGMVSCFVLDPMHLIYLGVVKRLMNLWLKGSLEYRLSPDKKTALSRRLEEISAYMPHEFSRKPRSLDFFDRFKAKEFRTFLLYLGPLCLKGILGDYFYDNFITLSVAIRTLSTKSICQQKIGLCRSLLTLFVKSFKKLYGEENVVYNVHNLLHICDDCERFGNLDSISCFKFESYLGSLTRLIRKPNHILVQLINRLHEDRVHKNSQRKKKVIV